jgi:hypothetical protein
VSVTLLRVARNACKVNQSTADSASPMNMISKSQYIARQYVLVHEYSSITKTWRNFLSHNFCVCVCGSVFLLCTHAKAAALQYSTKAGPTCARAPIAKHVSCNHFYTALLSYHAFPQSLSYLFVCITSAHTQAKISSIISETSGNKNAPALHNIWNM